MAITPKTIPVSSPDQCGEQYQNISDDCIVKDTSPTFDIQVLYPPNIVKTQDLPLSGGAVLKLSYKNSQYEATTDYVQLFNEELSSLNNFKPSQNDIENLARLRIIFNSILRKVGRKESVRKKSNLPQILLTTYKGDDSSFITKTNQYVAGIITVCEFNYIPLEIIEKIIELAFQSLDQVGLGSTVGSSGVSFSDLGKGTILEQVMEIFPIYNIPEKDIDKATIFIAPGGFYTYNPASESIYIKMPDLSGKNSFGVSTDIFTDRNFYIEAIYNNLINRVKLEGHSIPPSIDFAGEIPTEFPDGGDLEIIIESNKNLSGASAYLSIVNSRDINISSLDSSGEALELFSAPILTSPVFTSFNQEISSIIPSPTIDLYSEKNKSYKESVISSIDKYFSLPINLDSVNQMNSVGLSTSVPQIDLNYQLGEMNRPELALFDSKRNNPKNSNDSKYTNPKLMEAREILIGNRPKIYNQNQIPYLWIVADSLSENEEGNYSIKFSSSKFGNINKESNPNIKFMLYVLDSSGQLARSPQIINIETESPAILGIDPDGFIGSREISPNKKLKMVLSGENLTNVKSILIQDENKIFSRTFSKGQNEDYVLSVSSNSLIFKTFKNVIEAPFNLSPSTVYSLSAITEYGRLSQEIKFYVSDGENNLIFRSPLEPKLGADEFVFDSGNQTISNIPVKPGQQALIKVKSKHRYFNGEYGLFAYIGIDIENIEFLKRIDLPSKILDANFNGKFISVASSFEFEFSPSFIGKDFYKISDKKAAIKLPGENFKDYNLASLINSNKIFYLIITSKSISELAATGQPISSDNFSILNLGTSQSQAFVYPPYIYGLSAILPGDIFISNFNNKTFGNFDKVKDKLQSKADSLSGKISTFEKISKLAILFYGDGDNNYKKRADFYIGTKKINKYLSGAIETIDEQLNLQLAVFENIKISEQGEFAVYISKKNKPYSMTTSSRSVIRTQTYDISGNFTKDSNGAILIPNRLPTPSTSFDNLDLLIPAQGSGMPVILKDSVLNFTNPISIAANFDVVLKDYSQKNGEERKFLRNITEDEIFALDSKFIYIPEGSFIYSESYLDSFSNGIAYLNLTFNEPQKISFNIPEIISIDEGANLTSPITKPDKIRLVGGREYTAIVKSSDKNFILLFDNNVVVNPKSIKSTGGNEWRVVFRSPKKIISLKCPIICVSITNATRKRSKFLLGDRFVIDVDSKMKSILDGTVKNKIPNRSDLINIIKDFPLRFINIKLDLPSIPTDLINSFCDMSFHLSADLKIALNGFQILMTPIQIIFCIIDVICALLNPPKLARAIIRLFQCLYDLILILPVICVPVMLLQLIIHLLILLECLLNKVLTIVLVINEIISILISLSQNAIDLWEAIKSLEELLSEYLFDLNVNLSVLDPIVSILAIFLQLLGLTFRFPCSITDDMDQYFCLDGTMVGGLIVGKMINADGGYNLNNLIPVGQAYSDKNLNQSILDNTSDPLVDPVDGNLCAIKTDTQNYLESMNANSETLRSTFAGKPTVSGNFNLTFSISATKSRKGLGSPDLVEFQFKEKGRNGFFNKKKIIEPDQTLDGFLFLTKNKNNQLTIETGENKNLISPVDNYEFITILDDTASARPLVLNVDIPIEEINPETGQKEVVGVETIPRTFDNIPSFAIVDEQNFVYFVEPNGIKLKNGVIDSIVAKVINTTSASKIKFDKEDVEIDTDSDGYSDDEAPVFEFPQLYFFDMRSIATDIETKCGIDFFNNELLQNDPDAIIEIVKKAQDCVLGYQNTITDLVNQAQLSLNNGIIPEPISVSNLEAKGEEINKCLNEVIDDICIYVVNTLNSQFKILEDSNQTPLGEFPITEITPELSDDFEIIGPTLTGAREYSDGIGDSADIKTGNFATIQITPRDSYDNVMPGDFSEKITVEIVSDTTGTANFIETNGSVVIKNGEDYFVKITSANPGIVKIRAKICEKTIQAVTYAEVANQISNNNSSAVDCVPDAPSAIQNPEPALGQLAKIDRILTIFFIESSKVITANINEGVALASPDPQTFGTSLEN